MKKRFEKIEQKLNICRCFVGVCFIAVCLCACQSNSSTKPEDVPITGETTEDETAQYLIMENDTAECSLSLYNYQNGYTHYYEYAVSTVFLDKYGKTKSSAEFEAGNVVTIGTPDADGYLTEVQMSDKVWKYENIRRFSIDEEKGIFTIADTNYSIRDGVFAFSNGKKITLDEISTDDILAVTGIEKKILSVVVTTGHGTLSLVNTELFEGSLMQLNKDYFLKVTKDMEVDIPEGTYTLIVANNGWGGTCELEIVRGEKTEIDLDTLKGEGKKTGLITFSLRPADASVYIDGKQVDVSQPTEVTYGTHILQIEAEGYEEWRKYLTVNSEKATLVISLTSTDEKESESEKESETLENDKETESEKASDSASEYEKRQEELEDLQETINGIIENTFGGLFD